jgi:hypothetical protein
MTGVDGRSVWVRSTTRTELSASAAASCVNTDADMIYSSGWNLGLGTKGPAAHRTDVAGTPIILQLKYYRHTA